MIDVKELTFEYLSECFDVDVENGILRWRVRPTHHFSSEKVARGWNTQFSGKISGYLKERPKQPDYWYLKIQDRHVLLHRAMWALTRGVDLSEVPVLIDHIDCNSTNNRPDNLRPATHRLNQYNKGPMSTSKHGLKGVRLDEKTGRWTAVITTPVRQNVHLGTFFTKEEAAAAYIGAAKLVHGEYFHEHSRSTQAAA